MKATWEHSDSWVWRPLRCGVCGRGAFRPPLSQRLCGETLDGLSTGCVGRLVAVRATVDGVHGHGREDELTGLAVA